MEQFFELTNIITLVGISVVISLTKRLVFTDPLLVKLVVLILIVKSYYDIFF